MAKTFYTDYVQHCMRFFSRYPKPNHFRSEADKKNWNACNMALKEFSDVDRDILIGIYKEGDTIPDNIYQASKARKINQDTIWKLCDQLEHKVAKRRGLI